MRIVTFATAACLALLGTIVCAQSVTYDFDRSADFTRFKTYAWVARRCLQGSRRQGQPREEGEKHQQGGGEDLQELSASQPLSGAATADEVHNERAHRETVTDASDVRLQRQTLIAGRLRVEIDGCARL